MRPIHAELVDLVGEGDVSPVMEVVRDFHHEDGVADNLGWHLSSPVLDFLATTRCPMDVDEYDFE